MGQVCGKKGKGVGQQAQGDTSLLHNRVGVVGTGRWHTMCGRQGWELALLLFCSSLFCSFALSLFRSFALSLFCSSLFPSFPLLLFALSLFALSLIIALLKSVHERFALVALSKKSERELIALLALYKRATISKSLLRSIAHKKTFALTRCGELRY